MAQLKACVCTVLLGGSGGMVPPGKLTNSMPCDRFSGHLGPEIELLWKQLSIIVIIHKSESTNCRTIVIQLNFSNILSLCSESLTNSLAMSTSFRESVHSV